MKNIEVNEETYKTFMKIKKEEETKDRHFLALTNSGFLTMVMHHSGFL